MKIQKYFLLQNKKIKSWLKYWLYIKSKDKNYVLSDILQGTSFYLENSSNKNFNLFQVNGNSIQDGTPTPSNQVPINSAGDNGIGSINEVISNKNLCNGINQNYFINANATRAGVASDNSGLLIKTDGISSYTISTKVSQARYRVGVSKTIPTSVSGITLYNGQAKDGTNNSITINSNGYDYLIVNATDLTNIQIEKGSSATSFVSHQEQNISIPCQQPMRSIGNVRDEFVKQDGVWYEKHNLRQRILNGNENWILQTQTGFYRYGLADSVINNETSYASQIIIKSDSFKGITFNNRNSDTNETIYVVSNGQQHNLFINTKSYTTLNDFKNWLNGNNIAVLYLLNEPNYIVCTQEQIQALESIIRAYTYEPITNINSTDNIQAWLKIQYYMEV